MTTPPTSKDLLGGNALSVKFEAPGDTIEGTLLNWSVSPVTKMGTGEIDTFPSGDPKYQFILTIQTGLRNDIDDDGRRTLYAKSHLFVAIKQAVASTGAEDFEKGAWISATFTHLGEPQRGMNPPKMFVASYKRPSAQVISGTIGDMQNGIANVQQGLGGQQGVASGSAATQPVPPPAPQAPQQWTPPAPTQPLQPQAQGYQQAQPAPQQPQQPAAGPTPQQVAALIAAGVDPKAVYPNYQG
jgi:hypothetical protein